MTEEAPAHHPTMAGLDMEKINCCFCSSALDLDDAEDASQSGTKDEQERLLELALGCCHWCHHHRTDNGTVLRQSAVQARLRCVLAKEENPLLEHGLVGEDARDCDECSSDEDGDDWQDAAFDMTDENWIRRQQQKPTWDGW